MPGPFVEAALFCERVLEQADDNVSLINVSSKIKALEGSVGEDGPTRVIDTILFLSLRSGDVAGTQSLRVTPEGPPGKLPPVELSVAFEGGLSGVQVQLAITLPVEEVGVYWFGVSCGDMELTRVPLAVAFE